MTEFDMMNVDEVKQHLDNDDALVVNVLNEDEYTRQHIPGSRNVPVGSEDFEDRMRDLVSDHDKTVIVYCQDPDCEASPKAAKKLVEMGYQNVYDFEGGIEAWKEAGFELEGEKQTVQAEME